MPQIGFHTFALIVNFLNWEWVPCHVTIVLFEAPNTSGVALLEIVKPLLAKFKLISKVIACVKNEGKNLATLNFSLSDVISCGVFQLEKPYSWVYFGHVLSKVCQYAINEDVVCQGMKEIFLKKSQSTFQKTIMWMKKSGKGRQEWETTRHQVVLPPWKLKILVKTKFVLEVVFFLRRHWNTLMPSHFVIVGNPSTYKLKFLMVQCGW